MTRTLRLAMFMLLVLTGCALKQTQEIQVVETQLASLNLPVGNYRDAAWLSQEMIAFSYEVSRTASIGDESLLLYDLKQQTTQQIPFMAPSECTVGTYAKLGLLPNGSLGFLYECGFELGQGFEYLLYEWDMTTGNFTLLYQYPLRFRATQYSFAPDMTHLFQEEQGDGIYNKLFYVDSDGALNQFVPDYWRVGAPAWSPDGQTFAFAASPQEPSEKSSIFTGLVAIDNALFHPWNIYFTDADLANQREILTDIQGLSLLRWSPNGRFLAFDAYKYKGSPGIWAIDMETNQVIRIWNAEAGFEWSPDSQQMLITKRIDDKLEYEFLRLDVSNLYQIQPTQVQ